MKLELNDPLWGRIFKNIMDTQRDNICGKFREKVNIEKIIRDQGIHIEMWFDGRWKYIELPDGDDLTMLLLRWA